MIRDFFRFQAGAFQKYFRTRRAAKIITTLLFLAVFFMVAFSIYGFFEVAFRYIRFMIEREFRLPLTFFLYEVFFLLLSLVMVLSGLITGVFQYFKGERDAWIMATPGYKELPNIVFVRGVLASSWPLLVMFVPASFAFMRFHALPVASFSIVVVAVLLLLFLLNALTSTASVGIAYAYHLVSRKYKSVVFSFTGYVSILGALSVLLLGYAWYAIKAFDFVKLFRADDPDAMVAVSEIGSHFVLFPTHYLAQILITLETSGVDDALPLLGMLLFLSVCSLVVWSKVSSLSYVLWLRFQEGNRRARIVEALDRRESSMLFTGSSVVALMKKEALVMTRNMKGVFWLLFLLSVWVAQIAVVVVSRHNILKYEADISSRLALLYAFQFVVAVYFVCAFALRFVFPSFSVEKKVAWLLGSAPISFKKMFWSKYAFFATFFVGLGVGMNVLALTLLKVAPVNALKMGTLFVLVVLFVVTLGAVLGAVFPNTESDDPEIISTSLPGLFFTGVSLLGGALGAWALYLTLTNNTDALYYVVTMFFVVCSCVLLMVPFQKKHRTIFAS